MSSRSRTVSRYEIATGSWEKEVEETLDALLDEVEKSEKIPDRIVHLKDNWPLVYDFITDPNYDMRQYALSPNHTLTFYVFDSAMPLEVKPGDVIIKKNGRLMVHNKPGPPTGRMVREFSTKFCYQCGSSMERKWPKFWQWKCINPKCESNKVYPDFI